MSTIPTSSPSTLAAPRLVFLDALRVLAIVLVVILHAMAPVLVDTKQLGQPGWYLCMLQNPINRAGVPLFFMISGLLLLQDPAIHTPLSFYRRRLPRLLLPLAVWNGIYLLLRTRPDSFRSSFEDYFRTLLTNGSCYHMWFIYTILGIYLVAPVLGFLAQRGGRTYLMILLAAAVFPTSILPLINRVLPFQAVVYTPMAEGLLGYFILGFLLGTTEVPRPARMAVYLAGGAGYCTDLFTDLATSTAQSIPIPSQNVYRLSHYFVAAALFLWVRSFLQKHPRARLAAAGPLERLSRLSFGVFWVHILLLEFIARLLDTGWTTVSYLCAQISLTVLLSFLLMGTISRLPFSKLLL